MKLCDILKDTAVSRCSCAADTEITDICYDSRRVTPGALFVAIRGLQTDGHLYIAGALERGAAAILCEQAPEGDGPYIVTENSRRALAEVSACFFGRPQESMTLIGVTGTNGKTTVTNLIKFVLEEHGGKVGLIGTNGNFIGGEMLPADRTTPESRDMYALLAQMRDAGCTHAVMEVSSHALCLYRVHGLRFRVGVFTNLTRDHLDFHGTMENYLEAKAGLIDMCDAFVINGDDKALHPLRERGRRLLTVSAERDDADYVAKNIKLEPDKVEFEMITIGDIGRVRLHIPGMFSVYNGLCAAACCAQLGMNLWEVSASLRRSEGIPGRAEVVRVPANYGVIIDYAHSPDGIENILRTVRGATRGRLIAVFGCGGDRDRTKRPLMGAAAAALADICVVTSDNPRTEEPRAIIEDILPGMKGAKCTVQVIEDRVEAIRYALTVAREGDTVALLGKGHETYQEVCGVKNHMDEREIVHAYFAEKAGERG